MTRSARSLSLWSHLIPSGRFDCAVRPQGESATRAAYCAPGRDAARRPSHWSAKAWCVSTDERAFLPAASHDRETHLSKGNSTRRKGCNRPRTGDRASITNGAGVGVCSDGRVFRTRAKGLSRIAWAFPKLHTLRLREQYLDASSSARETVLRRPEKSAGAPVVAGGRRAGGRGVGGSNRPTSRPVIRSVDQPVDHLAY